MRRKPLAAMLVLLSASLVLGGNALLDAGRGARGCAQGSGPLSAALVQFRREFQEVNMARILAVDDERAILDALARVLGRDGHEVLKAADPTAVPGMDLLCSVK